MRRDVEGEEYKFTISPVVIFGRLSSFTSFVYDFHWKGPVEQLSNLVYSLDIRTKRSDTEDVV